MSARFETEILYVTKSEYRDGWGFKEHVHPDYFQVFCVLNGELHHRHRRGFPALGRGQHGDSRRRDAALSLYMRG